MILKEDLSGQHISNWQVIKLDSVGYSGSQRWLCRCVCGTEQVLQHRDLKGRRIRHCGCKVINPYVPKVGEKFAMLTVLGLNDTLSLPTGRKVYDCLCECGNQTILERSVLVNEVTKSCGCLQQISIRTLNGMSKTPEYRIWCGMKGRCNSPTNKAYRYYGARGIQVCDRWQESFMNFYEDMGPRPYPEYSLDRIDCDGHYEPGNVRWATPSEQLDNRKARGMTLDTLQYKARSQDTDRRTSDNLTIATLSIAAELPKLTRAAQTSDLEAAKEALRSLLLEIAEAADILDISLETLVKG